MESIILNGNFKLNVLKNKKWNFNVITVIIKGFIINKLQYIFKKPNLL